MVDGLLANVMKEIRTHHPDWDASFLLLRPSKAGSSKYTLVCVLSGADHGPDVTERAEGEVGRVEGGGAAEGGEVEAGVEPQLKDALKLPEVFKLICFIDELLLRQFTLVFILLL